MLNVCLVAKLPESPTEARNPTPDTPTASGLLTEQQQRLTLFILRSHLPAHCFTSRATCPPLLLLQSWLLDKVTLETITNHFRCLSATWLEKKTTCASVSAADAPKVELFIFSSVTGGRLSLRTRDVILRQLVASPSLCEPDDHQLISGHIICLYSAVEAITQDRNTAHEHLRSTLSEVSLSPVGKCLLTALITAQIRLQQGSDLRP